MNEIRRRGEGTLSGAGGSEVRRVQPGGERGGAFGGDFGSLDGSLVVTIDGLDAADAGPQRVSRRAGRPLRRRPR